MRKLLLALAALPFLSGLAIAGQPIVLNDAQMDKVAAGFYIDFFFAGGNLTGVLCSCFPAPELLGALSPNFVLVDFPSFDGYSIGFPIFTAGKL